MHPKERRSAATRREFLARTGGAAFALSGASGLLAACSNSTNTAGSTVNSAGQTVGPGGLPLARPNRRVTLPLWEQPIPSGHEARDRRRRSRSSTTRSTSTARS